MKVVLLAGGLGTRMREETEYRPKPMVEIGGRPVLWHIMKHFSVHGLNEFVVCAGYRGEVIKDFFLHYHASTSDFTVTLANPPRIEYHSDTHESEWRVTVVDTGLDTPTGGRVSKIRRFVGNEPFMVTYGDGLGNVDITALLAFHRYHGRLATVTTVRPLTRFGVMDLQVDGKVSQFREKPQMDGHVNAGFFVFEPGVLDYLDDQSVLEQMPLEQLAKDGELIACPHDGFWQPMDTYREYRALNDLWDAGDAPWKTWS